MSSDVLKKKGECLENDSGLSVKARALIESKRRRKKTVAEFSCWYYVREPFMCDVSSTAISFLTLCTCNFTVLLSNFFIGKRDFYNFSFPHLGNSLRTINRNCLQLSKWKFLALSSFFLFFVLPSSFFNNAKNVEWCMRKEKFSWGNNILRLVNVHSLLLQRVRLQNHPVHDNNDEPVPVASMK